MYLHRIVLIVRDLDLCEQDACTEMEDLSMIVYVSQYEGNSINNTMMMSFRSLPEVEKERRSTTDYHGQGSSLIIGIES